MRQKAVSSAPQKVDPTYTLVISANTPKLVELLAHVVERAGQRVVGGGGEQLAQVGEHALFEAGLAQHAPGDEQREQGQREDRQQHVVGDHARQPREPVVVDLAGEVDQDLPLARGGLAAGGGQGLGSRRRMPRVTLEAVPEHGAGGTGRPAAGPPRRRRAPARRKRGGAGLGRGLRRGPGRLRLGHALGGGPGGRLCGGGLGGAGARALAAADARARARQPAEQVPFLIGHGGEWYARWAG